MAPEARAGARPDPRMDVYAVGALLITHADRPSSRRRSARHRAAARRAPVPPAIAAVIARATAIDPARRTPDAKTLGDELAALAAQFKAAPQAAFDLPPEERVWRGAVALLAAVATAIALYAALVSLTPRTMSADDALPFTAFGNQPLGERPRADARALRGLADAGRGRRDRDRARRLRPAAPALARGRPGTARARSPARRQRAACCASASCCSRCSCCTSCWRHRAAAAVKLHPGHRRLPRAAHARTASGTRRWRRSRPTDRWRASRCSGWVSRWRCSRRPTAWRCCCSASLADRD